jgi:hypothetical protein
MGRQGAVGFGATDTPTPGGCLFGLFGAPNFVFVDQVDITVRLNLRMRVQLGSAA